MRAGSPWKATRSRASRIQRHRGSSSANISSASASVAAISAGSPDSAAQRKGPFRWAALSGDPADIAATDALALEMFADDEPLCRWIRLARERVAFQGLPARIFWLGYGERARFGLALNDLVRRGVVSAPLAIGRDHLDTGSVASPNRETEGMRDGSDAIADWPVLNALLNASAGATWVSVHHGGGVGI